MPWKFVEGITVADVAFEATGRSLDDVFSASAEAVTATMVKEVKSLRPIVKKELELSAVSPEQLLHDFLEELVYLKDAELLLFGRTVTTIKKDGKSLTASLYGEKLNPKRHELLVDVKAVTWHGFSLKKSGREWRATAVLDV